MEWARGNLNPHVRDTRDLNKCDARLVGCRSVPRSPLNCGNTSVAIAATDRSGLLLAGSEALATFGLLVVIFGVVRSGNVGAVPGAVGAYIAGAIYFTASASFANPAVTVARALSDTYTGIAPGGIPGFVGAQIVGALVAAALISWLFAPDAVDAHQVVVPHDDARPRHEREVV